MKILIYGDFYLERSGFAREIRNFIQVAKDQNEIRQVALNWDGTGSEQLDIPCYPARRPGMKSYWGVEALDKALDDFRPDLLFSVHDLLPIPHLIPVLFKSRSFRPRWVHWGTLDGAPVPASLLGASAAVDLLVMQSKFGSQAVEHGWHKLFSQSGPVAVVYPGVERQSFKPLSDRTVARVKYETTGRFTVALVARNQFRKNIPVLMEGISLLRHRIPSVLLLLHCLTTRRADGRSDAYQIKEIADELGLSENLRTVTCTQALNDSQLNELYNAADVHCLPSMGEGFGLPLIEAMAAGIPNVATDCTAISEVLSDGRGILIPPATKIWVAGSVQHHLVRAEEIAQAIEKLHNDPELCANIVAGCNRWVEGLEIAAVCGRLIRLLEETLLSPQPSLAQRLGLVRP